MAHQPAVIACPHCGTRNRVPRVAKGHPRCASCHQDLPWIVDADDTDFDEVVDTNRPVLVDLWAPWCGPCRIVAPGVELIAKELAGRLKVVKVNVDEAPRVATTYDAMSIPTLLVLQGGETVGRQVGAVGPEQLKAWVEGVLTAAAR
jgi:thioredoxin 2